MAELTREQFVEKVLEYVRSKFPLVKLARGGQAFSLKVNGHVASLENLYRIAILNPEEMRHHVERWMVELLRAAEGRPDTGGTFEELKDRIFPLVLSSTDSDLHAGSTVTQPLLEGLMIGYGVDDDRTILHIPRPVFDSWKIPLEQLHETAIENLVKKSEAIAAHAAEDEEGNVNLILFQTMDGYDASRILLPTLHERLRQHLGSPFVAGIPNRDILLCFRDDPATVDRLRSQIKADFRAMPHQVTDRLLLITPDGIAPHD